MLDLMAKKPAGRPKNPDPPPKAVLHIEVPPELKAALQASATANHRKLTGEIIAVLEDYLRRAGLWPPPDDPEG